MRTKGYMFYIGKMLLPVTPSKLNVSYENANRTLTLIDEGQVNILKKPNLTNVEFTCEIPQVNHQYCLYNSGFINAQIFLKYFENLKQSKKPFQFIVVRMLPNLVPLFSSNMKVTLEDWKIIEDANEGFDLKVQISLKQYRHYGTKIVKIKGDKATKTENRSAENSPMPTSPQSVNIGVDDNAYLLSKKYYGNGEMYTKILDANPSINSAISPGVGSITIPAGK